MIKRFSVWQVQLNPIQGAKISKIRPCFAYPSRVFRGKDGLILLDQLRTVDKARLITPLGYLDDDVQIEVCERLVCILKRVKKARDLFRLTRAWSKWV